MFFVLMLVVLFVHVALADFKCLLLLLSLMPKNEKNTTLHPHISGNDKKIHLSQQLDSWLFKEIVTYKNPNNPQNLMIGRMKYHNQICGFLSEIHGMTLEYFKYSFTGLKSTIRHVSVNIQKSDGSLMGYCILFLHIIRIC